VAVVAGLTTADVSWVVADDGNSPLTEIQFAIDDTTTYPSGLDDSTTNTASPYTLTGLTPDTSYTVYVRAKNDIGLSDWSEGVAVTAPSTPTAVTAVAGLTTADISWVVDDSGNSLLTEIQFAIDDTTTYPSGLDDSTTNTATPYTLTGLTPNTSYTVYVRARNGVGLSGWSEGVSFTPSTLPSRPRILRVSPGDDSVSVSWIVDDTKGYSLKRIEFAIDDTVVVDDSTTTLTSPTDVTQGLTNDASAVVFVRGITDDGASGEFVSEWSLASNLFTPSASSVPVTGLTVLDVDDTQNLSEDQTGFTAVVSIPAQTAPYGPPFTITALRDDAVSNVEAPTCVIVTNGGSCTVTGAVDPVVSASTGANYRFTISPTVNGGRAPNSTPSGAFVIAPPGALTSSDVTITAGDAKATVTVISAPTGGGPVVTYAMGASPPGGGPFTAVCTITVPSNACDLTGLTPGVEYTVAGIARNSIGSGTLANLGAVVPTGGGDPTPTPTPPLPSKPSAPGSVSAVAGNASATVTWTAATAPADAPVIIYRSVASPGGQSCQAPAAATTCSITGLTNGTTYLISVTAINAGGQGPAATSNPVTPAGAVPGRPGRPVAVAGNAQATVSFTPASSGGAASTYTVTAAPGGATCTVAAPGTECIVTGLTNDTAFRFTVTATNSVGSSPASRASVAVTPSGDLPEAPAAPSAVSGVAGDGEVTVSVTPGSGGGDAESFRVVAAPGGASCEIEAPDSSCVVDGLTNGTAYRFTATASNAGGTSPVSPVSAAVTPRVEAPAPPAAVRVLAGDGRATVVVTPGSGGGEVDQYLVTASPGGQLCVITPPAVSCVVTGLTNGVAYEFSVRASNAGGSASDAPSAPVTPDTPIDPTPVPLVDPPAPGQSQAEEDGQPVQVEVAPDRAGTGLQVASNTFTLDLVGEDNRGNSVGLQNDAVLLLVDDGRARTSGTGFRPGSQARLFLDVPVIGDGSMLRVNAASAMDLGALTVDDLGEFAGTVRLPADLAPGEYVLQVVGVTQANGERAVSLGVRVVANDASITLIKGKRTADSRRLDRVRSTGTSVGIPAGTKLVPYFRFGKRGAFKQGKASIIVQDDGTFRWTRKVRAKRPLIAYVMFASAESNTVRWARIR